LWIILRDRLTRISFVFLLFVLTLGLIGPSITPYEYDERIYNEENDLVDLAPPSADHPLGTTDGGYDVLSRMLYGAQPTVITGLLGGTLIITIGMTIGITAGYFGGKVDTVLMRITDFAYGIPLLPFAILVIAFIGAGFIESVVVIGLLLWRANARVLRSQVLQVKERPFVLAAQMSGASSARIIIKHILPNVGAMAVLFFALGIGYSIILQAGLAFVGVSNPYVPSWGIMVRNAYQSGLLSVAWWWAVPPILMISFTVLATFLLGRQYEKVVSGDEGDTIARGAG